MMNRTKPSLKGWQASLIENLTQHSNYFNDYSLLSISILTLV